MLASGVPSCDTVSHMEQANKLTFRMDTEIIPPKVDIELAEERNRIINAWREHSISATAAYESMERLYWHAQPLTNTETRMYLRQTAYEFPVESGITEDESSEIYLQVQADPDTHPYVRIFEVESY